jgi:Putative Phosphatase
MCKGHILDTHRSNGHVQQPPGYNLVVYIGDGSNDMCPALRLKPEDLVLARRGFSLAKRIAKPDENKPVAKVVLWDDGFDILSAIKGELSKLL